ncbi:hypothetical protein TREMEDRAFT_29019 [Tremella mesenterica DSM 1558]|uniref:uncharacterized protein n=1 Tax=Tremella mesenterica (strain ATCC 24925 / CBS 8224 / DSM 1558 / NBRC 9311 / NRRL Y-6157 / RJB 2259-6 / UBC 559-6) TaxID=578456 RepID=UPI0003F494A9|nr:uncharacterized protein TREMEDRAFT_29019 [Tremella mesenterica DSM 1558]EIW70871.1 hypothetical protein TREMEDRAFT_29019 [Tremella mesenterica DSM 1558]
MPKGRPKDLLLLIWVHGFKGNEVTFESFPDRVSHLLQATHPSLRVESRVFPVYQTRGELHAATLAFVDWLTSLVVGLENDHGFGGGAGRAKIVLLGHSMGGLLIADAALDIARNTRPGDPMWPKVVAIVAFDTPYLGLHPRTLSLQKYQLSQAAGYLEQARSIASGLTMLSPIAVGLGFGKFGLGKPSQPSHPDIPQSTPKFESRGQPSQSSSRQKQNQAVVSGENDKPPEISSNKSRWSLLTLATPSTNALYGLGAVALGAAAVGTMYYRREDFVNGWKWGYEHMTFVRNLWDEEGLRGRLLAISQVLENEHNVKFWNFYTHLPPSSLSLTQRTFTILPPQSHPTYPLWIPATNTIAKDEVSAHMAMFSPKTNDGFYDLGLAVARRIAERIEEEGVGRGAEMDEVVDIQEKGLGWREEVKDGKIVWVEE